MSHFDSCWRISVIYRCCKRLNKSEEWALEQITRMVHLKHMGANHSVMSLPNIWFRKNGGGTSHIDMARKGEI